MRRYSDNPKQRAAEEKCEDDIERYGLHVLKVHGGTEWPEFAYSVGLFQSFEHPEVIILGLPGNVAHDILNHLADILRSGKQFAPGDETDELVEGYPCMFLSIPFEQLFAHFGWAIWYYDDRAFPAMQLVYPDRMRRWPWEAGVSPVAATCFEYGGGSRVDEEMISISETHFATVIITDRTTIGLTRSSARSLCSLASSGQPERYTAR